MCLSFSTFYYGHSSPGHLILWYRDPWGQPSQHCWDLMVTGWGGTELLDHSLPPLALTRSASQQEESLIVTVRTHCGAPLELENNVIVKWEVTALTWETEQTNSLSVQTTLTPLLLHQGWLRKIKEFRENNVKYSVFLYQRFILPFT